MHELRCPPRRLCLADPEVRLVLGSRRISTHPPTLASEPGVVTAFEKVYGTKDLIVSFDAVNVTFPKSVAKSCSEPSPSLTFAYSSRKDLETPKAWPHQDQDPEKPGSRVLQGLVQSDDLESDCLALLICCSICSLVNLLPNGPEDGGFIVCKGGHRFSEEYHKEFKARGEKRIPAWYVTFSWVPSVSVTDWRTGLPSGTASPRTGWSG